MTKTATYYREPEESPTGEEIDIVGTFYVTPGRKARYTMPPSAGVPEPPTIEFDYAEEYGEGEIDLWERFDDEIAEEILDELHDDVWEDVKYYAR